MGYCMTQQDTSFRIKKENQDAAFQAATAMPDKDYHWVKMGWCKSLRDIGMALETWRYEPEYNDGGDIVDVRFTGEKLGAELDFFQAIAPFVEKDSYIEMDGEDGSMWRWVFDGTTCKEVYPTITWKV